MPLFFASNAIYPAGIMPESLETISLLNPLTDVVDALRMTILVLIGARMYLRLAS